MSTCFSTFLTIEFAKDAQLDYVSRAAHSVDEDEGDMDQGKIEQLQYIALHFDTL